MPKKLEIKWFESTDSTNNRALEESANAPDRFTWAADFQTAGRGQRGNKWLSKAGENLMFSTIFKPDFISAQEQFAISQICTLGLHNYLKNKGVESKIKWPNDIYVAERKICGILIENAVTGDKLSQSICGIGLNINQKKFPDNLPNPTSMVLEKELAAGRNKKSHISFDTHKELPVLLKEIFKVYNAAKKEYTKTGEFKKLTKNYLSVLYRIGEFHMYEDLTAGGKKIEAKIAGIDSSACLVLENKKGERKSFAFKEVNYVL